MKALEIHFHIKSLKLNIVLKIVYSVEVKISRDTIK